MYSAGESNDSNEWLLPENLFLVSRKAIEFLFFYLAFASDTICFFKVQFFANLF